MHTAEHRIGGIRGGISDGDGDGDGGGGGGRRLRESRRTQLPQTFVSKNVPCVSEESPRQKQVGGQPCAGRVPRYCAQVR